MVRVLLLKAQNPDIDGFKVYFHTNGQRTTEGIDVGLPQSLTLYVAAAWFLVDNDSSYSVEVTAYTNVDGGKLESGFSNALELARLPDPEPEPQPEPPPEPEPQPEPVVEEPEPVIEEPEPEASVVDPALVHWWRLGHRESDIGHDYGHASRSIDVMHSAVGISAANLESGADGSYVELDGSSEQLQSAAMQQLSIGTRWSLALWLRPDDLSRNVQVLDTANAPGFDADAIRVEIEGQRTDDSIHLTGHGSSGQTLFDYRVANRLLVGRWSHVAATYDGEQVRVFVDGEEAHDKTGTHASVGQMSPGPRRVTLGARADGSKRFMGALDSVAVWNEPLSADEIAVVYDAGERDFDVNGRVAGGDLVAESSGSEPGASEPEASEPADLPETPETAYAGPDPAHQWQLGANPDDLGGDTGTASTLIDLGTRAVGISAADAVDGTHVDLDGGQWMQSLPSQQLGIGNAWTLSMWVRPDRLDTRMDLLHTAGATSKTDEIDVRIDGHAPGAPLHVQLYSSSGRSLLEASFPADLIEGSWAHLALRWDGSALRVDVDGQPVTATSVARGSGSMFYGPRQLTLGADASGGNGFVGGLGGLEVWKVVLSDQDVSALSQ